MPSEPSKPLLKLEPHRPSDRQIGEKRSMPKPEAFSRSDQTQRFSPQFNRLASVLARDPDGLTLRRDPTALAPERLLVFEVRGAIPTFVAAVRKIKGLELIDEEELGSDEDKAPIAYLMMPDIRALRDLEGLWRRWQGDQLVRGESLWSGVFGLLRNIRTWGPNDRINQVDVDFLVEEIEGSSDTTLVRLEIELVYRDNQYHGDNQEGLVRQDVISRGGRVVSRSRIGDIAYHALLVDLPVSAIRDIASRLLESVAGVDSIMHIRPQSIATGIDLADTEKFDAVPVGGRLGEPILALLDGVPVAAHPLLERHVSVVSIAN